MQGPTELLWLQRGAQKGIPSPPERQAGTVGPRSGIGPRAVRWLPEPGAQAGVHQRAVPALHHDGVRLRPEPQGGGPVAVELEQLPQY